MSIECVQGGHFCQRGNSGLRRLWCWLRNGYVYDRCIICGVRRLRRARKLFV